MTMTPVAECELRDLIERLDRNELRALDDAATFLQSLRFGNGRAMNESPTFVAEFADGEETRMTVLTSPKKLDVERGVRLARHAYRSRKQQELPPIIKALFERDGKVLETYSAVDLEDDEAPL